VFYVDNPATERVVARARAARHAAGTLLGHAAGQPPTPPARRSDTLLGDVLAVIPPSEPKVWSETVLERLAALRPDLYGTLTRDQLTAALKPYGITTGQVWGTTADGRAPTGAASTAKPSPTRPPSVTAADRPARRHDPQRAARSSGHLARPSSPASTPTAALVRTLATSTPAPHHHPEPLWRRS
jgi:hypothetical protein